MRCHVMLLPFVNNLHLKDHIRTGLAFQLRGAACYDRNVEFLGHSSHGRTGTPCKSEVQVPNVCCTRRHSHKVSFLACMIRQHPLRKERHATRLVLEGHECHVALCETKSIITKFYEIA